MRFNLRRSFPLLTTKVRTHCSGIKLLFSFWTATASFFISGIMISLQNSFETLFFLCAPHIHHELFVFLMFVNFLVPWLVIFYREKLLLCFDFLCHVRFECQIFYLVTKEFCDSTESILARCCWRTSVVHQWFNKCKGNESFLPFKLIFFSFFCSNASIFRVCCVLVIWETWYEFTPWRFCWLP